MFYFIPLTIQLYSQQEQVLLHYHSMISFMFSIWSPGATKNLPLSKQLALTHNQGTA